MLLLLFLIFGLIATPSFAVDWDVVTPLDEYVHAPDPAYGYEYLDMYNYTDIGAVVYIINMTSQTWQDDNFSDRSVWWHIMSIAIPYEIRNPGYGFVAIAGGSNRHPPSYPPIDHVEPNMVAVGAVDMGAIGATITKIPNQPIRFVNDPYDEARQEDDMIAWTWNTYVYRNNGSLPSSILARFPMTKACKMGLDTINSVAQEQAGQTVDKFFVTGASKRGWSTWSLAATDKRVVAAAPIVFSLLNVSATMQKHYKSLGGYTFALSPYYFNNITKLLADPDRAALILPHEDMYSYKERFTIPMVVISSTGDEFFQPDDSVYWLKDLPGWKKMLLVPNMGHGLGITYVRAYETMVGFFHSVVKGEPLPEFTYSGTEDDTSGYVTVDIDDRFAHRIINMTGFAGESNNDTDRGVMRRDFRVNAPVPSSVWFDPVPVEDLGGHTYRAAVEKVDEKYMGMFIETIYTAPEDWKMWLTTEFHVAPDTFPYEECQTTEECEGELV